MHTKNNSEYEDFKMNVNKIKVLRLINWEKYFVVDGDDSKAMYFSWEQNCLLAVEPFTKS